MTKGYQAKVKSESINVVILLGILWMMGTAMAGPEGALEDSQLNNLLAYIRSLKS